MEPAAADTRSGRTEFVVTAIAELTRSVDGGGQRH